MIGGISAKNNATIAVYQNIQFTLYLAWCFHLTTALGPRHSGRLASVGSDAVLASPLWATPPLHAPYLYSYGNGVLLHRLSCGGGRRGFTTRSSTYLSTWALPIKRSCMHEPDRSEPDRVHFDCDSSTIQARRAREREREVRGRHAGASSRARARATSASD